MIDDRTERAIRRRNRFSSHPYVIFAGMLGLAVYSCDRVLHSWEIHALHCPNVACVTSNRHAERALKRATRGIKLPPSAHDISLSRINIVLQSPDGYLLVFSASSREIIAFAEAFCEVPWAKMETDPERWRQFSTDNPSIHPKFLPWKDIDSIVQGKHHGRSDARAILIDTARNRVFVNGR